MEGYRTEKVIEYTDGAEFLTEMDTNLMLKTLDQSRFLKMERRLNVKMKGSKERCRLGGEIPDRLCCCRFMYWLLVVFFN